VEPALVDEDRCPPIEESLDGAATSGKSESPRTSLMARAQACRRTRASPHEDLPSPERAALPREPQVIVHCLPGRNAKSGAFAGRSRPDPDDGQRRGHGENRRQHPPPCATRWRDRLKDGPTRHQTPLEREGRGVLRQLLQRLAERSIGLDRGATRAHVSRWARKADDSSDVSLRERHRA